MSNSTTDTRHLWYRYLLIVACFAQISVASIVAAEARTRRFDIPPTTLGPALLMYAHQAEVELLVDANALGRVAAIQVRGNYTNEEALQRLLGCTGFVGEIRSGAAYVHVAPKNDDSSCGVLLIVRAATPDKDARGFGPRQCMRDTRLTHYARIRQRLKKRYNHFCPCRSGFQVSNKGLVYIEWRHRREAERADATDAA